MFHFQWSMSNKKAKDVVELMGKRSQENEEARKIKGWIGQLDCYHQFPRFPTQHKEKQQKADTGNLGGQASTGRLQVTTVMEPNLRQL